LRIWAKTQKPRPISLGIWATNPYSVEIWDAVPSIMSRTRFADDAWMG
jgi:hypothetical protein